MAREESEEWRKAYAEAFVELDPKKLVERCDRARRLVQDKMVSLAAAGLPPDESLEQALRDLWTLQEKAQRSLPRKPGTDPEKQ